MARILNLDAEETIIHLAIKAHTDKTKTAVTIRKCFLRKDAMSRTAFQGKSSLDFDMALQSLVNAGLAYITPDRAPSVMIHMHAEFIARRTNVVSNVYSAEPLPDAVSLWGKLHP